MSSIILLLTVFIQDWENRSLDTLRSDHGTGFIKSVPYFDIDEYSGHVSASLTAVGPGHLSVAPQYKMPNRLITNTTPLSRAAQWGRMGRDWHFGPGYLLVNDALVSACGSTRVSWQSVNYVSAEGNVRPYFRDLLFVDVPGGADASDYGPDVTCQGVWRPNPISPEDKHFVASDLSRITKTDDGFYWMLQPDGTKVKFRKTNTVFNESPDPINAFWYWVPVELITPEKRVINFSYLDDSWQIHRVFDHENERYLEFHYERYDRNGLEVNPPEPLPPQMLEEYNLNQPMKYVTRVDLKYSWNGTDGDLHRTLANYCYQRYGAYGLRFWQELIPAGGNEFYRSSATYEIEHVRNSPVLLVNDIQNPKGGHVRLSFIEDIEIAGANGGIQDGGFWAGSCRILDPEGNDCDFQDIRRNHLRVSRAIFVNQSGQDEQSLTLNYQVVRELSDFDDISFHGYEGGEEIIPHVGQNFLKVTASLFDSNGQIFETAETIYSFPEQDIAPSGSSHKLTTEPPPSQYIGRPLIKERIRFRPVLATSDPTDFETSRLREEWLYQDLIPIVAGVSPENRRIGGSKHTGFLTVPVKTKYHRIRDSDSYSQDLNLWNIFEYVYQWPNDWRTGPNQGRLTFDFDFLIASKSFFKLIDTSGNTQYSNTITVQEEYLHKTDQDPIANISFSRGDDLHFVLGLNKRVTKLLYATPESSAPIRPLEKIEIDYFDEGFWEHAPLIRAKRIYTNSTDFIQMVYEYHIEGKNTGFLFRKDNVFDKNLAFQNGKHTEILNYEFGIRSEVDLQPIGNVDYVLTMNADGNVVGSTQSGVSSTFTYDDSGRRVSKKVSDQPVTHYQYASAVESASGESYVIKSQDGGIWTKTVKDEWGRTSSETQRITDTVMADPTVYEYNPAGVQFTTSSRGSRVEVSSDIMGRAIETVTQDALGNIILYQTSQTFTEIDFGAIARNRLREVIKVNQQATQQQPGITSGEKVTEQKTDLLGRVIESSTNKSEHSNNFTSIDYTFDGDMLVQTIKPYGSSDVSSHRTSSLDWVGRVWSQDHPELVSEHSSDIETYFDNRGLEQRHLFPLREFENTYDHRDRLVTVSSGTKVLTEMIYDDDLNALVKSVNHLGSTIIQSDFDNQNRPTKIEVVIPKPIGPPKHLYPEGVVSGHSTEWFTWDAPDAAPNISFPKFHVKVVDDDGVVIYEDRTVTTNTLEIPWQTEIFYDRWYTLRIRAYTEDFEPSLWAESRFLGDDGESFSIQARRSDESFPYYGRGDKATLEFVTDFPYATIHVWREKDGMPYLNGVPLPHGLNQTDANGNLTVSFDIWEEENAGQDLTAFCGKYTNEYFGILSPVTGEYVYSNVIPAYSLSCEQAGTPAAPIFVDVARGRVCQINFGEVEYGTEMLPAEKLWIENNYRNNNLGSYVEWSEVTMTITGTSAYGHSAFSVESTNSGLPILFNKHGYPVEGLQWNERGYVVVKFDPFDTSINHYSAEIKMHHPLIPANENENICFVRGDGINNAPPVIVWGLNNGPNHPVPYRYPPIQDTSVFDIGQYVPGDLREFYVYNPNPCPSGYPCFESTPWQRGRVNTFDHTGWVDTRGNTGKSPWYPLSNADLPPTIEPNLPVTYSEYSYMSPEGRYPFSIENLTISPGEYEVHVAQFNSWHMLEPYDTTENDTYYGRYEMSIKANVVNEPYLKIVEGGNPIIFPPMPLGESTNAFELTSERKGARIKIMKNVNFPVLPVASGSGDFQDVIVDQPLLQAGGAEAPISEWYKPEDRWINMTAVKVGTMRGFICLEERSGYFEDGRFGQLCFQAEGQVTPRLTVSDTLLDLGDVLLGEESFATFTITNRSWYQRLNGELQMGEGSSAFRFVNLNPLAPFPPASGRGLVGFSTVSFDQLMHPASGETENPASIKRFYIRFQPGQIGDFEQVVTVSLCRASSSTPQYQCDPYESESITFIVRGRCVDPDAPIWRQYRSAEPPERASFSLNYNALGQMDKITPPHLGSRTVNFNRIGSEEKVYYETDRLREVAKVKDYRSQNSAGVNVVTGSPSLVRMQSSYASGKDVSFNYDDFGRLTSKTLHEVGNENSLTHKTSRIEYDPWGNIEGYRLQTSGFNHEFDHEVGFNYDELGQLKEYTLDNGESIHYTYDEFGNMTKRESDLTISGSGFSFPSDLINVSYNKQNQINNWQYDQEGRITDDGLKYRFDAMGRLSLITDEDGNLIAHHLYDAGGRRVRKLEDHQVTYYYRLHGTVVEEKIIQFETNEVTVKNYLYHAGEAIMTSISQGRLNPAGDFVPESTKHEYAYFDHLGSPVVRWDYHNEPRIQEYSPFGLQFIEENTRFEVTGFAGHEDDEESGQTYMNARYYIPELARFNRPDPAGDFSLANPASFNLYQYVNNNPVNIVDPLGLNGKEPHIYVTHKVIHEIVSEEGVDPDEKKDNVRGHLRMALMHYLPDAAEELADNAKIITGIEVRQSQYDFKQKSTQITYVRRPIEMAMDFMLQDTLVEGEWAIVLTTKADFQHSIEYVISGDSTNDLIVQRRLVDFAGVLDSHHMGSYVGKAGDLTGAIGLIKSDHSKAQASAFQATSVFFFPIQFGRTYYAHVVNGIKRDWQRVKEAVTPHGLTCRTCNPSLAGPRDAHAD